MTLDEFNKRCRETVAKMSRDEIVAAFHRVHHAATGHSKRPYMTVPAQPTDADFVIVAAIDELAELRAKAKLNDSRIVTKCGRCGFVGELPIVWLRTPKGALPEGFAFTSDGQLLCGACLAPEAAGG